MNVNIYDAICELVTGVSIDDDFVESICDVTILPDEINDFYYSKLIALHPDCIVKEDNEIFPFMCSVIYGSIIGDKVVNIESNKVLEIVDTILDRYKIIFAEYHEDHAHYLGWADRYLQIVKSEVNIDDVFIYEILKVSEMFMTERQNNIFSYWDFLILMIGLFPKEVYGGIEVDRLRHSKFEPISEVMITTHRDPNIQTTLISDKMNICVKCYKKLFSMITNSSLNDIDMVTSKNWNEVYPQFVAVSLLSVLSKCKDSEIGMIMYDSLC